MRGDGFDAPRVDYADPGSIEAGLDEVFAATGGTLDALFNNGAYACPGAVEDLPTGALREIFEANLFGWHHLTRAVVPAMRDQGHGRIVQCSSVLGFTPMRWRGAYVATKFALEGLTDTLRLEMADTPVRVISLQVGPTATRIRQNAIPHFERWIDWRASARRDQYENQLLARLYDDAGPDTFEVGADHVARVLRRALESRRPRPRYRVTVPTRAMEVVRRVAPLAWRDALLRRS